MISMQLKFDSKKTESQLRNLGISMQNFPQEMRAIGKVAEDFFTNDVFSKKGGAIGASWPARKAPTGSWPLLQKTGTLRKGWDSIAENRSVTIFNPVDYAGYHQTGTRRMPQRKIMGFGGKLPDLIQDKFVKVLSERIRRALRIG